MNPSRPPARIAKVTGIYRWVDDARFDHAYYETTHAALTTELLAPLGLLRFECDRTVGPGPRQAGDVVATSNAYFPSVEAAGKALAAAGARLAADIPNYTSLRPVLHLSEVVVHDV